MRPAEYGDAVEFAGLVTILAAELGAPTSVTPPNAADYHRRPRCHALPAVRSTEVLGLISDSVRPSLYHAADSCLVDELIVQPAEQHCGFGPLLLSEVSHLSRERGCTEISLGGHGVEPGCAARQPKA